MAEVKANSDPVGAEAVVVKEKFEPTTSSQPSSNSPPSSSNFSCSPPCRIIFALMGFFCFFNVSSLRDSINVAIVSMVNVSHMRHLEAEDARLHNATILTDSVVCDEVSNNSSTETDGPFKWDSIEQGTILGGFAYGYLITQLPGGMLAQRYGGKLVLLVGVAWTALWIILTPAITEAGDFAALIVIRILEGIGEGVAYPAMHVMLSHWAPPMERGRMVTFVYAGAKVGAVVTMPVSGVLCQMVDWQSVFYVFGAIGILWSVMWIFLVYDSPSVHPRISVQERQYIENSQGAQRATGARMKTPWLKIVTSPAVYALLMGNFAYNWGNMFMLAETPTFLTYILKFDIQDSGLVAGAPYLSMWFGMMIGGAIADFLLFRHLMRITWLRKMFVVLGFVAPAICLVGLGYVNCEKDVAVVLLVITGFCLGLSWAGWGVNHLDIAPPFAGTLFGITSCISTVPGFATTAMVGALTFRNQTRAAWRVAFYITGAILLAGTVVFVLIGSGRLQKWGHPEWMPTIEVEEVPVSVPVESTKTDDVLSDVATGGEELTVKKSTQDNSHPITASGDVSDQGTGSAPST